MDGVGDGDRARRCASTSIAPRPRELLEKLRRAGVRMGGERQRAPTGRLPARRSSSPERSRRSRATKQRTHRGARRQGHLQPLEQDRLPRGGREPGTKLDKATKLGVATLDEKAFVALLDAPPSAVDRGHAAFGVAVAGGARAGRRRRGAPGRRRSARRRRAATFSSRCCARLVPGIGTMSSPCASTQASASCAGVHALARRRSLARASTSARFLREVLALEARVVAPEVARPRSPSARAEAAGQEAAAERAVGDEADAELAHGRQDLVLGIAGPQRVLGLQRRDRMRPRARGGSSPAAASDSPR